MIERPALERSLRRIEWITAAVAVFLYSGAVFPLLLEGNDGMLDDAERARLRLLFLPIYALTLALIALRPAQLAATVSQNLPMMMLLVLAILSVTWSVSQTIAMRRVFALIMSTAFAYLLATRFTPRQQVVLLGGVLSLTTCLSLLAPIGLPALAHMPGSGELRGIFIHKNVLGWTAGFTFLLGLAARSDSLPAMRRASWALLPLGLAGTVLSGSATGLVSTVVAIVVVTATLWAQRRRGPARLAANLLLLVAGLLALVSLTFVLLPLLEFLGKDATLTGRVPLWHLVDAQIARRPLLGFGYGTFWSEASPEAWKIWAELRWQAPHAHNGYRDVLLGTGIVGLTLFALVSARALRQATELCTLAPEDGWIWCFSVIVASLVMNMAESTILMQNDLLWILFATSALSLSLNHAAIRAPEPHHLLVARAAV